MGSCRSRVYSGTDAVDIAVPGDVSNDAITSEVVGDGAVTVNVSFEVAVVVNYVILSRDDLGAVCHSTFTSCVSQVRKIIVRNTSYHFPMRRTPYPTAVRKTSYHKELRRINV